jgi:hypothetical protein
MNISELVILGVALVQAATVILVFAVARQTGVILTRIGPQPRRPLAQGPPVGETPERVTLATVKSELVTIGGPSPRATMVVFVTPKCASCVELIPAPDVRSTRPDLTCVCLLGRTGSRCASTLTHYEPCP